MLTIVIGAGSGGGGGSLLPSVKGYYSDPTAVPVAPPSDGDRWLVKTPGVNAWVGHDEEIAEYEASIPGWVYTIPTDGDFLVNEDDPDAIYIFDGTSGTWVKNDPRLHALTHQNGGDDEIDVGGLSGELADNQNPKVHGSTHSDGQPDVLDVADLGSLSSTVAEQLAVTSGAGAIDWKSLAAILVTALDTQYNTTTGIGTTGGGLMDPILAGTAPIVVPAGELWQVFATVTFNYKTNPAGAVGPWAGVARLAIGAVTRDYALDLDRQVGAPDERVGAITMAVKTLAPGSHTVQFSGQDDGPAAHVIDFDEVDLTITIIKG